jgi:hypothetical protein
VFLKRLCVALLVANVGYFAYSQGWLGSLLGSGSAQREPQRLAKQIDPDALGVSLAPSAAAESLPSATAVSSVSVASSASNCNISAPAPEQWRVYMGPYANKELLAGRCQQRGEQNLAASWLGAGSPRALCQRNRSQSRVD